MKFLNFCRFIYQELHKLWILKIKYPINFPNSKINSLLDNNILEKSRALFVEENVIIKNKDIIMGKHVYVGNYTTIDSCSKIGSFTSISSGVKIGVANHPLSWISTSPVFYSKYRKWIKKTTFNETEYKSVIIEEDVLISANVIIINGVKIGRGAVIGAGSVVTKDIPAYAIVAGVPATIIRYRFDKDIIKQIEDSEWWNYSEDVLRKYTNFANLPIDFINKLEEK